MIRIAVITAIALTASACVQTVDIKTAFNPAEHAYINGPGSGVIVGQAFMRRNDGMVVYGAGSTVYLFPLTSYFQEVLARSGTDGLTTFKPNLDPRIANYARVTQANGEGRFRFTNVPDGRYLVGSSVQWMAGNMPQGGSVSQSVTISNGQPVEVILTR